MDARRRTLELQAGRIEAVLQRHHVPGWVQGGEVTPGFVRFRIAGQVGRISDVAEEIAAALGQRRARIYRQGSAVHVEVPRLEPVRLLALSRRLAGLPPLTAILGVEEDGTALLLRLNAPEVGHVLVAGGGENPRLCMARTLLVSLAMYNRPSQLQILLLAPYGDGLQPLAGLPHVLDCAGRAGEAAAWLTRLAGEAVRRREPRRRPALLVAVDELEELLQWGGPCAGTDLARLLRCGHLAGIHWVICSESWQGVDLPAHLVKLIVRGNGEEPSSRDDFCLVSRQVSLRFRAARLDGADLASAMRALQAGRDSRRRRPIQPQQVFGQAAGAGFLRRLWCAASRLSWVLGRSPSTEP